MTELDRGLGFDNILILPASKSNIKSRKDVYTRTKISRNYWLKYPIIASPMDTISDVDTCIALNKIGAAGVLHRFMPIDEQVEKAKRIKKESCICFVAVGLKDYKERMLEFNYHVVDVFFLDTANINTIQVEEFVNWFKKNIQVYNPSPDLVIGNTLTKESVDRAITSLDSDGIRVGIGTGGACSTTDVTGIGCPPITTLQYTWNAFQNYTFNKNDRPSIILDGGIKKPADLVKAIVCGADAVMCGSIFAGRRETPGEIFDEDGFTWTLDEIDNNRLNVNNKKLYKRMRGMASLAVQKDYNLWDGTQENLFVEGKEIIVPFVNESVIDVVYRFNNGLRSAMSYLCASSIEDIRSGLFDGRVKGVVINV